MPRWRLTEVRPLVWRFPAGRFANRPGNPNPMGFNISGIATFLNNQTPSGTLLRGYRRLPSPSNGTKFDELASDIVDAQAFSLL